MEELRGAVRRMREKNTAPGPNGVPGKIWASAMRHIGDEMRHLFTRCLKEGSFPSVWRRAKLVLLRKENKPADTPSGYRPICLDLSGRGGQTSRKSNSWPTRPALGRGRTRPARAAVWVPPSQKYCGRHSVRPRPGGTAGAGGQGSRWSGVGCFQRL